MKLTQTVSTGLLLLTSSCLANPAAAQTTIGTTANGAIAPNQFGSSANYFGQIFTVPTDNVLDTFSVQVAAVEPNTTFAIYAYDSSSHMTTGNSLFSSGPVAGVPVALGNYPYSALEDTYQTGALTLAAGGQYVALIQNITPTYAGSSAPLFFDPVAHTDYYPDGFFTVASSPTDYLSVVFPGSALAFRATFASSAAVPEASTTVSFSLLLALGLGGVAVAARKRKTLV